MIDDRGDLFTVDERALNYRYKTKMTQMKDEWETNTNLISKPNDQFTTASHLDTIIQKLQYIYYIAIIHMLYIN